MELREYIGNKLIIMICSDCNINCRHCYISYKGNRTPEELLEIVSNLKDRYQIELNGAEVLTNLDYLKAFKLLGQHFILSNGKAIIDNPDTIDKLIENDIRTVSLSYHFGIQDKISVVSESTLNNIIKILKDNGIEVRLMTTIDKDNFDKIEDMCNQASTLGARAIKFTNYIAQGNAINLDKENILNDYQKEVFFEELSKARKSFNIEDLLIERCGTFGKSHLPKDNFKCTSIIDSVVLTPDNNIYPCVFLAKPGYEIGTYQDGKILIQDNLYINKDKCLADEICNKQLIKKYRNERGKI